MMNLGPRLSAFAMVLFGVLGHKALARRHPEPKNAAGAPLKRGNHRVHKGRDPNKRHRRV